MQESKGRAHLVEIRMALGILGDLEQRFENVGEQGLEGVSAVRGAFLARQRLRNLSENSRDLHHPFDALRHQIVPHNPRRQHVPLAFVSPINAQPRLQVHALPPANDFSRDIREEAAVNSVVVLEEDFTQALHAKRLVFFVEFVEALPHGGVCRVAYAQRLQAQISRLSKVKNV